MREYSYRERHMGTDVCLSFICQSQAYADTLAAETFLTIRAYEQCFSRFLSTSELTKLNKTGISHVSDEFMSVLTRSLELTVLTEGNFNPLVQVDTLGYRDTFTNLAKGASRVEIIDTSYSSDPALCHVEATSNYVALGPRQQLDFGGILKGYLATVLADHITTAHPTCTGLIINIGGDLATRGVDEFHEPFIFLLYNPVTASETPVVIKDMALATSGTYARNWSTSTGSYHHIVDNQTHKNPSNDLVSVSIIVQDGALSEALTKLFLTRGTLEATRIMPPDLYQYQYFTITSTGIVTSTIT